MALPPPESRISIRGLWQFHEVRERFALKDPQSPQEIIDWFKGKNHVAGTPYGPQVWLDLCKLLGQEPLPYDEIPRGAKFKLQIEHWFLSSLAGDSALLNNGVMALFALEAGFNNSSEFKDPWNYTVKVEFFGKKNAQVQARYMNWANMTRNRNKPSLAFLHSAMCPADDITTAIYASSGLRNSGRTRQLTLSFESTAPAAKRARIEDITESVEEIDTETADQVSVQASPSLNNELSVAMHVMAIEFANLERQFVDAMARPTQTSGSSNLTVQEDGPLIAPAPNAPTDWANRPLSNPCSYSLRPDGTKEPVHCKKIPNVVPTLRRLIYGQPAIRLCARTGSVDAMDVYDQIYKSHGAAKTAFSKHFGKKNIEKTATHYGFHPRDLTQVVWSEVIGDHWEDTSPRWLLPINTMIKILPSCKTELAKTFLERLVMFNMELTLREGMIVK